MEWVNITAKSLPEAIDLALDNLGVDESEAEIEVLEEPKQGLFGRVRGNARVRARVKPRATRPKVERGRGRKRRSETGQKRSGGAKSGQSSRGDSGKSGSDEKATAAAASPKGGPKSETKKEDSGGAKKARKSGSGRKPRPPSQRTDAAATEEASMDEVSSQLEGFLAGLTEAFGFDDGVSVDQDPDEGIVASVVGRHGLMVGPRGRTLDAIQELARVSAQRTTPSSIRIKVDVGGYRAVRRTALENFAAEAATASVADGKERSLEPMSSADRKVVHDALSENGDVETRSAGSEPHRRVVVVPVAATPSEVDELDESDEVEATEVEATEVEATEVEATEVEATEVDEETTDVEAVGG